MALDYFTLLEFRALPDMDDTTLYPDARVEAAAAYIVGIIEGACQTSFIARPVIETLDTNGSSKLLLSTPYVLGVSSVVIDGQASTDTFTVSKGVVQRTSSPSSYTPLGWGVGRRNVTVTYSAGYSAVPPADIKEAALRGTRAYLMETSSAAGVNERRSSITNDQGTTNYVMAGPDHPTGYPVVDAVITRWARKLNTVTFP